MNPRTEKLYCKYWSQHPHPYKILDGLLSSEIVQGMDVLEQGCGRTAPLLSKLAGSGARLYGVDLVDFTIDRPGLTLIKSSVTDLPFDDNKFDLIFSRSVMEHVENPKRAYLESFRVLKSGGQWVFLTPNRWDYVSIISRFVPNRLHGKLVSCTEGRHEEDVFPVVYESNSWRQIQRLCLETGFEIKRFDYLGQHPSYLSFSPALYLLGTAYEKLLLSTNLLRGVRGWLFVVLQKSGEKSLVKK
jgi:SAM-dependent methyltransferase